METAALALVLGAAFLHALWNAILKAARGERAVVLAGISAAHALAGIALIALAEPPARASWLPLGLSTLLHYAYYMLLYRGYRLGDLSLVYPIARGLAPFVVALSAALLIGEVLPVQGWVGLAAISGGIGLLALQARGGTASPEAIAVAALLGLSIAAYSVADGIGIRASGSALGYMGWLFVLEFPVPLAVTLARLRGRRRIEPRSVLIGLGGGVFAVTAYGLVLYANTLAPLGAVSAVRESSVIIAALIGVVLFGERPWRGRLVAAGCVALGVLLLASGG